MVADYRQRVKDGKCGDESWWRSWGFKAACEGGSLSAEKQRDYGCGVPKWSPYFNAATLGARAQKATVGGFGDGAWWAQWGFHGAVSEHKRRDYGDGVPRWSMYYHSQREKDYTPEQMEAFSVAQGDSFWFKQFGFRPNGSLSEDKQRDYGFGIPKWSPFYRP